MTWRLLDLGDETKWADPEDQLSCDVEWRLRHHPAAVSRTDMLAAATLIDHYRELTRCTRKRAAEVVVRMRRARLALERGRGPEGSPRGDPAGYPRGEEL